MKGFFEMEDDWSFDSAKIIIEQGSTAAPSDIWGTNNKNFSVYTQFFSNIPEELYTLSHPGEWHDTSQFVW